MSHEGRTSSWLIEEYRTPAGVSPIRAFLEGLDGRALARAVALLRLLSERGNHLRLPASRSLGGGLFELRDVPSGLRMFYVFGAEHRIVLLDGMVKKRDDVPGATLKRLRGLQQDVANARRAT
jgi:hypothetical protein